jgi:hypothetical protein
MHMSGADVQPWAFDTLPQLFLDVVGNDGGDDVALGRADDFDLFAGSRGNAPLEGNLL